MSQFLKSPDTSRFSRCLIFNLGSKSFFLSVLLKGLDDEQQEEGQLLGQFIYDEDGDSLQTFFVSVSITKAQFLLFLFQSILICCLMHLTVPPGFCDSAIAEFIAKSNKLCNFRKRSQIFGIAADFGLRRVL